MKKLLLGSIALFVFSTAIVILQISCQKSLVAQPTAPVQNLNKTLLSKTNYVQVATKLDSAGHPIPVMGNVSDFYLINNDGTNLSKINIIMPPTQFPSGAGFLNPDADKIIFQTYNYSNDQGGLYSCLLDGSNLTKIYEGTTHYYLQGTY